MQSLNALFLFWGTLLDSSLKVVWAIITLAMVPISATTMVAQCAPFAKVVNPCCYKIVNLFFFPCFFFPVGYGMICVESVCYYWCFPVAAHIPLYLYPFLNTTSKSRPFEYLRLTSLGVIGALVKVFSIDLINFPCMALLEVISYSWKGKLLYMENLLQFFPCWDKVIREEGSRTREESFSSTVCGMWGLESTK